MLQRLPVRLAVWLVVGVAFAACDRTDLTVGGSFPTAPGGAVFLTAEPDSILPEFLPSAFCWDRAPFGARIRISIRSGDDIVIRGSQFELMDDFGGRFFPFAVTGVFSDGLNAGGLPSPLPQPTPIPLPQASPVPIPGSTPFDGLAVVAGGFRTLPTFVQFGCGVPSLGTLFISLETVDRHGRSQHSRAHVRIMGS